MLTLDQFDYHLPEELIAQHPADPRDSSKLLVLNRQTQAIEHHHFYDLPQLLDENTVIVRNNTKVIPARLYGKKTTGGNVEIVLNKRLSISEEGEEWEVLTKPGLKPNQKVVFEHSDLRAMCTSVTDYTRILHFTKAKEDLFLEFDNIGHMPIPPYIEWSSDDEEKLRDVYQTTFAKIAGSVAAPTAGLHFTKALDEQLQNNGVQICEITLHVGLGTFLPVKDHDITQHNIHSEEFILDQKTADELNTAKQHGKKILAVGTTTVRSLESAFDKTTKQLIAQSRSTSIYIYPPYHYQFVDQIITNFHLPKSTLLMLVSAFTTTPNTSHNFTNFLASPVGKAYLEAIAEHYRFYSFGDAMLMR